MKRHMCMDIKGAIRNAKMLKGAISVDGRVLNYVAEIRHYLQLELEKGRRVLPIGECNNFDYQTGCKGHNDDGAPYVESQKGGAE